MLTDDRAGSVSNPTAGRGQEVTVRQTCPDANRELATQRDGGMERWRDGGSESTMDTKSLLKQMEKRKWTFEQKGCECMYVCVLRVCLYCVYCACYHSPGVPCLFTFS